MEKPDNNEFAQSLIRMVIGVLTYVYISAEINSGNVESSLSTLNIFSIVFFSFSFVVLISLTWQQSSTTRRYISLTFDIFSATFSAYLTNGLDSVFMLIYIWIYIGYSSRYGKIFLVAATAMTITGFTILHSLESNWPAITADNIVLLSILIALPLYLHSLNKNLTSAIQEAYLANQSKIEFFSNMTHQIRTPIGGIVGMIDLLNKTPLDAAQKQYLQALSQSSSSLQEIVEDIADFSQLKQGNISISQQNFQPRQVINSLIYSLAPLAHEKNINLNYYINAQFPQNAFGDAQRLRQLLSNLIRYAIDKSTTEGVYIDIQALDQADDKIDENKKQNVKINISFSHGENAERIYAHNIPATDQALTLRIGSQLTRLMGGSFDIQYSDNNKIHFNLNFIWPSDDTNSDNTANDIFDKKCVLIFEPDNVNRHVLENYCQQLDIETYSTDGRDSLIAHILWGQKKHKTFDAIILCETLNQNTSHELIKRVYSETHCQSPIIYATYIQNIERTKPDITMEVSANIVKPVSLEYLSITLQRLFDKKSIKQHIKTSQIPAKDILLAEDSEINASIVYNHLSDMGHSVDVATDGNTALYAMHKHTYDIIFMDINMPVMDGLEATKEWRKLEPEQRSLPIIALTARATAEDRRLCMTAGMNDFMTKPVNAEQLKDIIEKHCLNE